MRSSQLCQIRHRCIPGLAKLPEKRKIAQTEKRQRDCVYDRSKLNRRYIKEWEKEYECLAYDDKNNAMFCSSTVRVVAVRVGKIPVQLESGEIIRLRPELTTLGRISKVSGRLVNFLV